MDKTLSRFIIGSFVSLYIITSVVSTIHVINFFKLSNPEWLAVTLAIAFEFGAAASLSCLIVLDRMNKLLVWCLFIVLTAMQAMGNTYYAYTHLENFQSWVDLFGIGDEDIIYQKRVLSLISGAILPLISLGFIKSLVDYLKPSEIKSLPEIKKTEITDQILIDPIGEMCETATEDIDPVIEDELIVNEPVAELIEVPKTSIQFTEDPIRRHQMSLRN